MEPKAPATESGLTTRGLSPDEDCNKLDVLRYMPLDRFLSLIELEAMWFSRLGALQDRFEGTNPDGFRAGILKIAEDPEAVEQLKSSGPWDQFMAVAEKGRTGDDGRLMLLVNCWFIGNAETLEMWRDYGDRGKGVAIRSTVSRLTNAFQIPGDFRLVSRVGRISYVDFRSHKLGTNDVIKAALIKDQSFAGENEVRVITATATFFGAKRR